MKSTEELNVLKEEVEILNENLSELTEEELAQVAGGRGLGGFATLMYCNACKKDTTWDGDYNDQTLDCPFCNAKGTFVGKYSTYF